jgi:hypothetical protein
MKRSALAVLGVCLLAGVAHAEAEAKKFLQDYASAAAAQKQRMLDDLSYIELGMSWVNVSLAEDRQERPLYCPANTLHVTGEQLLGILKKEVEASPDEGSRPFGLALMLGLKKAFPCPPK